MVPAEAPSWSPSADQDDRWYPDKLATLRAESATRSSSTATSGSSTPTARCSPRPTGTGRPQQPHQLRLAADRQHDHRRRVAVPPRAARRGAAVPRRRPARSTTTTGSALVALATGRIAYVDRPLYDYVQHGGAAARPRGRERRRRASDGAAAERPRRAASPTSRAARAPPTSTRYCRLRVARARRCSLRHRPDGSAPGAEPRPAPLRRAPSARRSRFAWLAAAPRCATGSARPRRWGPSGCITHGLAWRRSIAALGAAPDPRPIPALPYDAQLPAERPPRPRARGRRRDRSRGDARARPDRRAARADGQRRPSRSASTC